MLENGEAFEHLGQLDFLGNRINLNTGTIAVRAIRRLRTAVPLPGTGTRSSGDDLREKQSIDVVTIPRRAAVQTDLKVILWWCQLEGEAAPVAEQQRETWMGRQVEGGVIVHSGLKNDAVITQGLACA